MSQSGGRTIPVSLARRIVNDFLHSAMAIPLIVIQKETNVTALVEARRSLSVRPSWCSIFTKAYGKVVAGRPELQRVFLTFPWERIHEYDKTTADIVVETRLDGERCLGVQRLRSPGKQGLLEIDRLLARNGTDPLRYGKHLRAARRVARLPWAPLRRFVCWCAFNVSARIRSRYLGTFGVSSVGNWGVDSVTPIAPWTTLLHHGAIDALGNVTLRLTFDHRVLDGYEPCAALNELERILNTDMLAELREMESTQRLSAA